MSDNELLRKVLGESYLAVEIAGMFIDDDAYGGCKVNISTANENPVPQATGFGIGLVDAMFDAFKRHYAKEYESLESIELHDFKVTLTKKKTVRTGKPLKHHGVPGTDRHCEAIITIRNSYGRHFDFVHVSHSLTACTGRVVAQAVEHFINAERAYIALHAALRDAKERNRQDLVTRYTAELAEVVKCTSYASVLERIKQEVNDEIG